MKRFFLFLSAIVLVATTNNANAENISLKQAKEAGAHFMTHNTLHEVEASDLTLIYQITNPDLNIPACYFFNVADFGFVIMSGTTASDPIIGFSDESNLDPDNMAPAMLDYVKLYSEIVIDQQNADNAKPQEPIDEWKTLLSNGLIGNTKADQVVLMVTYWDQGSTTNPTFNMYCPKVGNEYCVTGCVATAVSQIMYYFRSPIHPKGTSEGMQTWSYVWTNGNRNLSIEFDTVFFDYAAMRAEVNAGSSAAVKHAVSSLCSAAGIATSMNYSPDGSGAYSATVSSQMRRYFRYTRSGLVGRANVGDEAFIDTIRDELLKSRPLYMSGSSSVNGGVHASGHAWVCDGYMKGSNTNNYHMNWGWGKSSGNGFYNLVRNVMNPNSSYNFTVGQQVIVNMVPASADSTSIDFNTRAGITSPVSHVDFDNAYPNPAQTMVYLPYSTTTQVDLQIYAIDGKLVRSQQLSAGDGVAEINVQNMPAGIYVYRAAGATGKFIVQ
ncbi:MAG: thiol protease/hemagglutinin PrtT [Bacteroidales bacterium]|nr:thiol protease/hemagglutinin PrtT [Bacteroidales bacterium]